jgi:hypothetical protein
MHNETLSVVSVSVSNEELFAREDLTVATQPQLQPALLRLSAMISQYFTRGGFPPGCFTHG